jgi:hypothetical protein
MVFTPYEITAASPETVAITDGEDNGRGSADRGTMRVGVSSTGTFLVKGGMVVDTSNQTEEAR